MQRILEKIHSSAETARANLELKNTLAQIETAKAELKNTLEHLEKAKNELTLLQAQKTAATTPPSTSIVVESKATVTKSSIFKAELPPLQVAEEKVEKASETSPTSPWLPSPVTFGSYYSD